MSENTKLKNGRTKSQTEILGEHLKKALNDKNSMEIRIWKMLTTQRKRTEARYHVNGTIMRDQCGFTVSPIYIYNQSGIKKTELRIHAIT